MAIACPALVLVFGQAQHFERALPLLNVLVDVFARRATLRLYLCVLESLIEVVYGVTKGQFLFTFNAWLLLQSAMHSQDLYIAVGYVIIRKCLPHPSG